MKAEFITVKVVQDFDGFRGKIVDTIVRLPSHTGYRDRKGRPQQRRKLISYKGIKHIVTCLPKSYGEIAGYIITLNCIYN